MKLIIFFWLYALRDEISKFTVRSELQMFDTVRGLEVGQRSGAITSLRRGRAEWNRWTNWLWECWTSEEKMGGWFVKIPIRSAETLLVVLDNDGGGGSSSSSILLEVCSCVKFLEFSL